MEDVRICPTDAVLVRQNARMDAATLEVLLQTQPDAPRRGFNAVRTTGIYCRDGCAGRPKAHNVSRYATAVAAEDAGY